jgi:hypothetical protein
MIKVRFWVTRKPGHFIQRGIEQDSFVHGAGVVFRSTPRRKRFNNASLSFALSRNALQYDGRGYYFYVKVIYGDFEDTWGRSQEFSNEAEYTTSGEAVDALRIFLEEVKFYV